MKWTVRTSLALLGVAHCVVAVILLPISMFFSVLSVPVLPGLIWLGILGFRLWNPNIKILRALRITHFVLLPFAVLLITFGLSALRAAERSAATGGGLMGGFGYIPIIMGLFAGALSVVSLWISYSRWLNSMVKVEQGKGRE